MDPEGISYEMDVSVTTTIEVDTEGEGMNVEVQPTAAAETERIKPSDSPSQTDLVGGTASLLTSLETFLGAYLGGYDSDNKAGQQNYQEEQTTPKPNQTGTTQRSPSNVSSVSEDTALQILAKETKEIEEHIEAKGADSDGLSQFALYDDKHQIIGRKKLERKPSDTATTRRMDSCSSNSSHSSANGSSANRGSWKQKWTLMVEYLGRWVVSILTSIATLAARNPYLCLTFISIFSFSMIAAGFFTNFHLKVENSELWPPRNSFSVDQANWLYQETKFNYEYRYVDMVVHAHGENVLTQEGVSRVFQALDVVQSMPDYQQGCKWAELVGDANQVGECKIHSIADFWNASHAVFEKQVTSDNQVPVIMSATRYPTGQRVDLYRVIGNPKFDEQTEQLISAESFLIEFDLPWSYQTEDFELEALDALFELQDEWRLSSSSPFRVEVAAYRSYGDEFLRSIIEDLPLLPGVFGVMSIFCCLAFWRRHKIQSRSLLGVGAVICIVFSIMTSFGILFLFGVPFTTSTSMLPFLMFGIGLDDAFILVGSYIRTPVSMPTLNRVQMTMQDVGLSIFITTATSTLAFALGCFSAIPSVRWLCLYACPAIVIDFLYQITFFIALIVLDERRIQAGKWDCCVCVSALQKNDDSTNEDTDEESLEREGGKEVVIKEGENQKLHWADHFMGWYADKLLQPTTQKCVVVAFIVLLAGSTYSASQLRQYFDLNELVPQDSYLTAYYTSLKRYGTTRTGLPSLAYFTGLNQSDPIVQVQMTSFLDELVESKAIAAPPTNFWLSDFLNFTNSNQNDMQGLSFTEQVEAFMSIPLYHELYRDHIVRDDNTGEVIDTRCEIYINVDLSDSRAGIAALNKLRDVARVQPLNAGLPSKDWKLFTYQDQYHLWEFYSAVISELTFTTIMGVVAVSIIALLLIPHWTAVLFVAPLIICLYVDMLGKNQCLQIQIQIQIDVK